MVIIMRRKIINGGLIAIGFVCIGIGSVGIVLPILPTTPFFLLALLCFTNGSKRFHIWFTGTKLYQKHLDSFVKTRSMTAKTKWSILIPVSVMLVAAAVTVPILPMRIVLGILIAIKYYYFVFRIKTIPAKGCETDD
jgi:uncharacterized membrane protein YbaN (DUF454 family)